MEGTGLYAYGFRYYDPASARFTGVDPLAGKFGGWSPYNYVMGNPIILTDPTGAYPVNDITINRSGEVVSIVENDQPHRLFIQTSKGTHRVSLNDPELDRSQLGDAKVGEKLVHFLSPANVNYIMDDAGVISIQQTLLGWVPEFFAAGGALMNSHGGYLDFGYSMLAPQLDAASRSESNYSTKGADPAQYSQWDYLGGFIFFEGNKEYKVYNIPDAGNFLWGHAMTRLGASSQVIWAGSNGNEFSTGGDSSADQQAIFSGSNLAHRIMFPLGSLLGYEQQAPSWFHMDGNSFGRNRR